VGEKKRKEKKKKEKKRKECFILYATHSKSLAKTSIICRNSLTRVWESLLLRDATSNPPPKKLSSRIILVKEL
jgi:hypothetical protein